MIGWRHRSFHANVVRWLADSALKNVRQPYDIVMLLFHNSRYDIGIDWKIFSCFSYSYSERQTQKGVYITMAGILIAAYLIIGALVFALIWVILIASKRRQNVAKSVKRGRLESKLFRETNTKPSRFQS